MQEGLEKEHGQLLEELYGLELIKEEKKDFLTNHSIEKGTFIDYEKVLSSLLKDEPQEEDEQVEEEDHTAEEEVADKNEIVEEEDEDVEMAENEDQVVTSAQSSHFRPDFQFQSSQSKCQVRANKYVKILPDMVPRRKEKSFSLLASKFRIQSQPLAKVFPQTSKILQTKDWHLCHSENRFLSVLDKVDALKLKNEWSFKQLKKKPVIREKVLWDYMIEEMQWLSEDFRQERLTKHSHCALKSRMIMEYWNAEDRSTVQIKTTTPDVEMESSEDELVVPKRISTVEMIASAIGSVFKKATSVRQSALHDISAEILTDPTIMKGAVLDKEPIGKQTVQLLDKESIEKQTAPLTVADKNMFVVPEEVITIDPRLIQKTVPVYIDLKSDFYFVESRELKGLDNVSTYEPPVYKHGAQISVDVFVPVSKYMMDEYKFEGDVEVVKKLPGIEVYDNRKLGSLFSLGDRDKLDDDQDQVTQGQEKTGEDNMAEDEQTGDKHGHEMQGQEKKAGDKKEEAKKNKKKRGELEKAIVCPKTKRPEARKSFLNWTSDEEDALFQLATVYDFNWELIAETLHGLKVGSVSARYSWECYDKYCLFIKQDFKPSTKTDYIFIGSFQNRKDFKVKVLGILSSFNYMIDLFKNKKPPKLHGKSNKQVNLTAHDTHLQAQIQHGIKLDQPPLDSFALLKIKELREKQIEQNRQQMFYQQTQPRHIRPPFRPFRPVGTPRPQFSPQTNNGNIQIPMMIPRNYTPEQIQLIMQQQQQQRFGIPLQRPRSQTTDAATAAAYVALTNAQNQKKEIKKETDSKQIKESTQSKESAQKNKKKRGRPRVVSESEEEEDMDELEESEEDELELELESGSEESVQVSKSTRSSMRSSIRNKTPKGRKKK